MSALGLAGCSGKLSVGSPATPESDGAPALPDTQPASPDFGEPSSAPTTYAWRWDTPQPTGYSLRGVFTVAPDETWYVGDSGIVVREVAGVTTIVREGVKDEVLTVGWGRGPNDLWVGGSRGARGVLLHWDGAHWTDSFPVATHPIDALGGLSNGNVVVVSGGTARLMHPEGDVVSNCTTMRNNLPEQNDFRDAWVQSDREIWLAGSGVAKWTLASGCTKVDDRPSLAVWGDGSSRIVVASFAQESSMLELRQREGESFVPLGTPFAGGWQPTQDVRGGKTLAGDASGRIRFVFHAGDGSSRHGVASYDPRTKAVTATDLWGDATANGDARRLYRETLYGLATTSDGIRFAGGRGLRGRFDHDAIVVSGFRRRLVSGMASPTGDVFALCTNYGEFDTTSVCRWDRTGGWSELPPVRGFYGAAGIAASADNILLGGWSAPNTSPARYRTQSWNGGAWTEGPQQTQYLFRPLFATGEDDVWAWSDYDTLHFDGAAWSTISHGGPGTGGTRNIDGARANDVWLLDRLSGLSHWDGAKLTQVAALPRSYTSADIDRALVAVPGGAWVVGVESGTWPQPNRLLYFDGSSWQIVKLPGIRVRALALGPDGRLRMLSHGSSTETPAVYRVSDDGVEKELDLPDGVQLDDLFAAGGDLFVVGDTGATLRLAKVAASPAR